MFLYSLNYKSNLMTGDNVLIFDTTDGTYEYVRTVNILEYGIQVPNLIYKSFDGTEKIPGMVTATHVSWLVDGYGVKTKLFICMEVKCMHMG